MPKKNKLGRVLTLPWRLLHGAVVGVIDESEAAFANGRDATNIKDVFRYAARGYFAPLTGAIKGLCKAWKSTDSPP